MANPAMRQLGHLGEMARAQYRNWQYYAAVLGTLLFVCVQPRYWPRTVRSVFVGQVFSSGVESVRFVIVLAVLVGLAVVGQTEMWTQRVGQSQLLGPLLVAVVARELAPLFANFVLIVRSGSAIATEMSLMKIGGEVRAVEAQGLDPLLCLVMPRVLGLAVAVCGLTAFFIPVAFASGYCLGALFGVEKMEPSIFLHEVFKAVNTADAAGIALKSLLPALLTGVICATEGLNVGRATAEVPLTARRALARSLGALFVVSVVISLLVYF